MKIIFEKMRPEAILPTRAHDTDAGMDFYTPHRVEIRPKSAALVETGLRCEFEDKNVFMLIKDKSGLAVKKGITVGAGVIDNGYRGEIKILLYNWSNFVVTFTPGSKIAQGIILPVIYPTIIEGEVNVETSRGEGGFGSTGDKSETSTQNVSGNITNAGSKSRSKRNNKEEVQKL